MSTAIRILLGVLMFVAINAAVVVVVLLGPRQESAAWAVSLCGLVAIMIPPFSAGIFVSYWTAEDADSRRWVGRRTWILIAIQVAGAVALIGGFVAGGGPIVAAVASVAAGIGLFVAAVALGGVARRHDRGPRPSGDGLLDDVRGRMRKARRNALVGAGIGLILGVALVELVPLLTGDPAWPLPPSAVLLGLEFVLIAAALGVVTGIFTSASGMRSVLGTEVGAARRIGRAIQGKPAELSADEEERAGRYAHLVLVVLPTQLLFFVLLFSGISVSQIGQLTEGTGSIEPIVLLSLYAVVLIVFVPLTIRRVGRIRAYADAHPIGALSSR